MKTIKVIEILGYATFSVVMWWSALSILLGNEFESVKKFYGGALTVFGVLALIIAIVLSYATFKNWREFRAGNFD